MSNMSMKKITITVVMGVFGLLLLGCPNPLTDTPGTATTYAITYDGNDSASGAPPADANSYEEGAAVTILGNTGSLVRTGYSFAGWNTAPDGSGTTYAASSTYTMGAANAMLYAEWIRYYLKSSTATGTGTTLADAVWSDVVSTSLDLTAIDHILVTASIDMWVAGASTSSRLANYRLDCDGIPSLELRRSLEKKIGDDHGMGSLVWIFDVSSLSDSRVIELEHANTTVAADSNVSSQAVLTVVGLTTNTGVNLNNESAAIVNKDTTTDTVFAGVANLSTEAVTLPSGGDIYVAASVVTGATIADTTGEWSLQYSTDNATWSDLGQPIQRNMSARNDAGMASLVAIAQGLPVGDYYFRVAHRKVDSGTSVITDSGSSIVAVALNFVQGAEEGHFPTLYTLNGAGDVNSSSLYETAASSAFTTPYDIGDEKPDVFLHAQFNMGGNAAMLSAYEFDVSGPPLWNGVTQERYISGGTDAGSGVLVGLAEDLDGGGSYTASVKHKVSVHTGSEELTTTNIILAGFQLFGE